MHGGMRIGHFLSHFPEPGGTTTMLLGLSSGLVEQGHEVFAYGYGGDASARSGSTPNEVLTRSEEIGITGRIFSGRPGPVVSLLRRTDSLTSWLASNGDDLDVLLIHGALSASSPGVAAAAGEAGIFRVACPHDPYSPAIFRTRPVIKRAYWRLVEAPFLRSVQAIHLLAPSHERYLRALGVEVPTFVVPNGLDRWPAEATGERPHERRTHSPEEGLRLLYFGRWDIHNKGLDLLLSAIAEARSDIEGIRLDVAGRATGSELETLRRLIASLGLGDEVSIVGFLPDLDGAIRAAHAVVLPSRFDGFGQVVLESLALGTPVIASSKAGAAEYLGENDGVWITEPNMPSIVDSLRGLFEARHRFRTSAQAARSRLMAEFNWSLLARHWVDHVGRIMSTRRA
jgi:glycosyltransferase involved in cell wall biosynthesis